MPIGPSTAQERLVIFKTVDGKVARRSLGSTMFVPPTAKGNVPTKRAA